MIRPKRSDNVRVHFFQSNGIRFCLLSRTMSIFVLFDFTGFCLTFFDFVRLYRTLFDFVRFYSTLFGFTGHCSTLFDFITNFSFSPGIRFARAASKIALQLNLSYGIY